MSKDNIIDEESINNLLRDEKALIMKNPLLLVEGGFLMIKKKKDVVGPLELNNTQKIIYAFIEKYIKEKKQIRFLILKARQMGASTLIEAIIYALTSQQNGVNSLVIAHELKGSNYIFEMQKLFHDRLDSHLKPGIKHSNEKKLEFEGIHSQVLIDTAENKEAGRGTTIRYCHISEAAFFKDLDGVMLGLNQAIPHGDGTMIVMESTANGVSNAFYDRWVDAVKGKTDWLPIFVPWFMMPEYAMDLTAGNPPTLYPIDGMKFDKVRFIDEEKKLREAHGLTLEQLNWRRWCIVNNCNGDIIKFYQEYPSTWEEAFIMSGSLYFDRDGLMDQQNRASASRSVKSKDGKIESWPKIGNIIKFDNKWIFRECEDGRFRIYEFPSVNEQYCIGGDAAEGLPHGDDSAMVVLNKRTNRTACAYNIKCDTDEFAEDLIRAGNFFNTAMIAPENKGYGSAVCKKVYNGYGNIYRKIRDTTGSIDVTDEIGWNTNRSTRDQMLASLKEEIREGSTDLLDEELLDECRTFINNPDKKRAEAEKGKRDDLVIARAIAGMVRSYYPYVSRRQLDESRERYMSKKPVLINQGYGFKKG